MKVSGWMALPLILGLSALTVACDGPQDPGVTEPVQEDQPAGTPMEGDPTGEPQTEGTN